MTPMFWAGTFCWIVSGLLVIWYIYIAHDKMTPTGVILKGLMSLSVVGYGVVLAFMNGHISGPTWLYLIGMLFAVVGDVTIGAIQCTKEGGTVSELSAKVVSQEKLNHYQVVLGIGGILFIVAYFLQMAAFIKGLAKLTDPTNSVVAFLFMALLPLLFTVISGILAHFRIPEVSTSIFIIGVFYILLQSTLFASASVFSFALFSTDPNHAVFTMVGAVLFFLSMLFFLMRYANPEKYDTRVNREVGRLLTFLGRMILAGCAFMF